MLDMARVHEAFEASTDFTVGIEEEFAILDPETRSLDQRFEELREAAQADPVLAESVAGELIKSEIEIRSGRGENFADAIERQRDVRARLFRLAAERDALLAATGTHPWSPWQEQQIIDTEHYRRVAEGLQYVAWRNNTFSPPRARGRAGARTAPSGSATGCGRCCPSCWRSRPTRPSSTGARPGCTRCARRSSPRASRAAASPTPSGAGPPTPTTSSFLVADRLDRRADPDLVERSARTTRSAPWSCASATPRRARRSPPRWTR